MTLPAIGAVLGTHYRLEGELGQGAMGRVYRAQDLKHGRAVAVKMLHGDLTSSINIERFMLEIQVISQLNHPHIVGLHDSGEFEGQLYYVMPLVEGETLRERLRREKRLSVEDAVRITLQICDALGYAHERGIVHRDIKPDNILLPSRNHAQLADFGLSRALTRAADRRLTATGFSLGTPLYMSPEQAAGHQELDGRSDIYSLGAVLFEMLTGTPPLVDDDVRRLLARKLSEPAPDVRTRRPDLPGSLARAVRTALAPAPAARFKTVQDFGAALQDSAFGALRAAIRGRLLLTIAVIALVLAGGASVMWRSSRSLVATGAMHARERVLIADFSSRSSDVAFATMVTDAFRIDLTQSPALTVVEPRRVHEALGRMGKSANTRLAYGVAREVALREGIALIIDGDVTHAGGSYVLTARLIAAEDQQTLAAFREFARDSMHVIDAIDRLSATVRRRAGETLRSLRRSAALAEVSTPSLPALTRYTQAMRAIDVGGDYVKAIPLLEEAIAIDTAFASAYRFLGIALSNQGGQQARAFAMITRAYKHRARLTEKERYLTLGSYYAFLEDHARAIAAYRSLLDLDSSYIPAITNMGFQYLRMGEAARAEAAYARAFRIDTTLALPLGNLVEAQFNGGKLAAARATHVEYRRRFPENPRGLENEILIEGALGQYGKAEAAAHALRRARSEDPRWRIDTGYYLAALAASQGRVREAQTWLRDNMSEQVQRGTPRGYIVAAIEAAELDLHLLRDTAAALAGVASALRAHPLEQLLVADRPFVLLGVFYAQAGEPARAREILNAMTEAADPLRVLQTKWRRRAIAAEIAIAEHNGNEALTNLRGLEPPECRVCQQVSLARAYEQLGQPDSAIAAYETYVRFPNLLRIVGDRVWLAFTYERLSELLESKGELQRSVDYARRLIALWEHADPPLQARRAAALMRVQRLSGRALDPPAYRVILTSRSTVEVAPVGTSVTVTRNLVSPGSS